MKLPRRKFLHLAAGAAALPALSRIARAQAYPSRPVRWIVPYRARRRDRHRWRAYGSMVVGAVRSAIRDRKPARRCRQYRHRGGRARARGWLHAAPGQSGECDQRDALRKANFNFIRDIAPVARIIRVPNVMEVNPSFPAKTVPEFIAYAKANPGKVNMASGGIGSPRTCLRRTVQDDDRRRHGARALSRCRAGLMTDFSRGQVQVMFDATASIDRAYQGRQATRAGGDHSRRRSDPLPDIPTVGDFVPGYEASAWFGIGAPKEYARRDRSKSSTTRSMPASPIPKLKAQPRRPRWHGAYGSPADFGKLIADETEKWAKVIKFAGIKQDDDPTIP